MLLRSLSLTPKAYANALDKGTLVTSLPTPLTETDGMFMCVYVYVCLCLCVFMCVFSAYAYF
jgi:hypothetical protein